MRRCERSRLPREAVSSRQPARAAEDRFAPRPLRRRAGSRIARRRDGAHVGLPGRSRREARGDERGSDRHARAPRERRGAACATARPAERDGRRPHGIRAGSPLVITGARRRRRARKGARAARRPQDHAAARRCSRPREVFRGPRSKGRDARPPRSGAREEARHIRGRSDRPRDLVSRARGRPRRSGANSARGGRGRRDRGLRGGRRAGGGVSALKPWSAALAAGLAVPARTPLAVAAVVETGFSEVDDGWAVVPLAAFERLAPPGARQGVWEMKLVKASASAETVAAARKLLGEGATVLDWKVLNRDLFEALAMQQTLLFIVLTLIVAVAAGTVVSSLVVLLAEKTRDVGVLAALGAPPALVARTFRLSGMLLGGTGLVLGVVFGLAVCFLLTVFRVVRFPPEIAKVYYLTWMPFRPEPLHVLGLLGAAPLLFLGASVLPARGAARMNASEALRYE